MAIKYTKYLPTKGTFSAIWEFEGQVWASTFKFMNDTWYKYDNVNDDWDWIENPKYHIPLSNPQVTDVKYAVIR